ncbi:probable aquaporin SIP2-1 isoform X1 [Durio zibethinus]|uniref:Probable aquaporin SIP2-1 isoform X1 n=1 Tax=Durio zibethinus TaxID=66656 RepID=A0A6P5YX61_DURZI|nr:probable aquaporin SIP2-1 isoform X1 [Durio zibethinus]
MGRVRLILYDFIISFMWVWSGCLVKMFVVECLGMGHQPKAEIVTGALYVINMFFFAFLAKVTKGGTYNPLTVFSSAVSGDFNHFLFTVGARIPAQFGLIKLFSKAMCYLKFASSQGQKTILLIVIGSITGVRLIIQTLPGIGLGPRLNVDIHWGALTEGSLTFAIVIISLGLSRKIPGSFFMKTWITSVSKLALHILGSDLTGGCMNPASVMGWAYARGDHITKEHILVYWLAPIEATLLAVWTFRLVVKPITEEKENVKAKSE